MHRKSVLLASVLLLAAAAATAQKVELTPFYGFHFGGEFDDRFDIEDFDDVDVEEGETYGAFLNFALDFGGQVEFFYSRQETELQEDRLFGPALFDLEIEYLHVGFLYQWAPGQLRPYVGASLGATNLEPEGIDGATRFSWSLGAGVKIMANNHFGLRLDGRFYSTFIDDDEVFCDRFGCFTYEDSTFFFQFDVKTGLVFAF